MEEFKKSIEKANKHISKSMEYNRNVERIILSYGSNYNINGIIHSRVSSNNINT